MGVGGLSKFGGCFPLEIAQPYSAPYRKRQPGRVGAPTTPQLQPAAQPRRPGALAVAFAFFIFFKACCFSDTFFFFFRIEGEKKKRARASACSGACSASRGSRLQLFLSRPNSVRASNFCPSGAQICLPRNSTLKCAPRPLAAVCSVGATLSRPRPAC